VHIKNVYKYFINSNTNYVDGRCKSSDSAYKYQVVFGIGFAVIFVPGHLWDWHVIHRQGFVRGMVTIGLGPHGRPQYGYKKKHRKQS